MYIHSVGKWSHFFMFEENAGRAHNIVDGRHIGLGENSFCMKQDEVKS